MLHLDQNITASVTAILLMIGDGEKYHYLAITNLSGLLEGNSSNHDEDF